MLPQILYNFAGKYMQENASLKMHAGFYVLKIFFIVQYIFKHRNLNNLRIYT